MAVDRLVERPSRRAGNSRARRLVCPGARRYEIAAHGVRLTASRPETPFLDWVVASSFSNNVSRKQKRKPRYPSREPAPKPSSLKAKSRARRQRKLGLAEIVDHAPKRRNDLLPKLAVSYVPIDGCARHSVAFAGRKPRKSRASASASKSLASASRSLSVRTEQSFMVTGSSMRRALSG